MKNTKKTNETETNKLFKELNRYHTENNQLKKENKSIKAKAVKMEKVIYGNIKGGLNNISKQVPDYSTATPISKGMKRQSSINEIGPKSILRYSSNVFKRR